MKKLLMTTAIVMLLATPATADLTKGWEAYDKGNLVVAIDEWLPMAVKGDVEAQFNLGWLYDSGPFREYRKALIWYGKAGNQGHVQAQFNAAMIYTHNPLIDSNHRGSKFWLKQAANNGHVEAQYFLSQIYAQGWREGIVDDEEASRWYDMAIANGYKVNNTIN